MQISEFIDLTKSRRSIRRFKPDPFPDECIEQVLEAARFAQSGANGQPWEFIVIKDREIRDKISDLVLESHKYIYDIEKTRLEELRQPAYRGSPDRQGQANVNFSDAPVFIAVCGDPRPVQATVLATHFLPNEGGPYAHFLKNMANATQILTLAVAACGLSSQWVSVNSTIEPRLKMLLDVPWELAIHTIVPIGYPAYVPPSSYRRELSEIVHYEKYDRSRYRSGDDIYNFIIKLRQKTIGAYPSQKQQ